MTAIGYFLAESKSVNSGERRLLACIRLQLADEILCSAGCRTPQASCLRSPGEMKGRAS
jgi:hypothetical protein